MFMAPTSRMRRPNQRSLYAWALDASSTRKPALLAERQRSTFRQEALRELQGLWKYRVRRFRIIDGIDRKARMILFMAVGHRCAISHTSPSVRTE